jgi:hypothetical protein
MGSVSSICSFSSHTYPISHLKNLKRQLTTMKTYLLTTVTIDLTNSNEDVDITAANAVIDLTESDDESVGSVHTVVDLTVSDNEMEDGTNNTIDVTDSDDGSIDTVHTIIDLTKSEDEMDDEQDVQSIETQFDRYYNIDI